MDGTINEIASTQQILHDWLNVYCLLVLSQLNWHHIGSSFIFLCCKKIMSETARDRDESKLFGGDLFLER